MRRSNIFWILAVVALIALVIAFSFLSLHPRNNQPYSTENPKPDGLKALYLLYQKREIQVDLWRSPYTELPDSSNQETLFIIDPQVDAPKGEQLQSLLRWVEKGNRIVLWEPKDSEWLQTFQFELEDCLSEGLVREVVAKEGNPWLKQMTRLQWPGACIAPYKNTEPVLEDRDGHILIAKRTVGKGSIYFIPESLLITNNNIDKADHVALPLAWTQNGKVWLDQTVHPLFDVSSPEEPAPSAGQPSPNFFSMLKEDGFLILLQILLVLLGWLYARGKRFAAPRYEMVQEERNALEYVEAMAKWYTRAKVWKEALLAQQATLRREVIETLHLPVQTTDDILYQRVEQYMGSSFRQRYEHLAERIRQAQTQKRISPDVFVKWSIEMDQLRKELVKWKTYLPQNQGTSRA
ncbi:DUF4350 domain-containing protein [Thermoflavimicrobium dichotomicum]|uniref:DUF4350 domain-containing protein n=1 Tax=Thermoflavimicrobium dichotomicum TaxID=46223 RepID=A0A1I3RVD2_9BACL|nr:DUF4350 domain-containing protein [Thermoflavimicrobium dichotomicum]SFJ50010.1 protein of unknown function [Thermoflavimicrobium dichotomicum]